MEAGVRKLIGVNSLTQQTFLKEGQVRIEEVEGSVEKNKDNAILKEFSSGSANKTHPLLFFKCILVNQDTLLAGLRFPSHIYWKIA